MSTEINLVKAIEKAIRETKQRDYRPYSLKYICAHVNLAHKGFGVLWRNWYSGQTPPKLEVDLLCVFEDVQNQIDDRLIIAVEIKSFLRNSRSGFYHGLDQVLAFSLFGFDCLSLWHLFSVDADDELISGHWSAVEEIRKAYELPFFYLAAKVSPDLQFFSYSPATTSGPVDYYLDWMASSCRDLRNPLLRSEEVRQRRRTIKAMLQIP